MPKSSCEERSWPTSTFSIKSLNHLKVLKFKGDITKISKSLLNLCHWNPIEFNVFKSDLKMPKNRCSRTDVGRQIGS